MFPLVGLSINCNFVKGCREFDAYFIRNLLVELELVTRIPGLLISGVPVEFPWVSFTAFFRSASVCAAEGSSVNRLGIRPWGGRNDGLAERLK